ncbi:MAG: hypothetical protein HMLIMOIP_000845 [Candidatus Nitrosomirales archaeon]|jgi:hypothetical protein
MNLHFIYVVKSDEWKDKLKDEWLYVYNMGKFYQWWLRKNFGLHYNVNTDVLVVVKTALMGLRFGMRDLMKHHKEKGEENYHFYLSYFRPRWSDCSSGFFTDNVGLIHWKNYDGKGEKNRFFALENCAQVSHVLLHEVGRQKKYGKKYRDTIHEQWDKHIYNAEEYEFYDKRFRKVEKRDDFLFATMKIPMTKTNE